MTVHDINNALLNSVLLNGGSLTVPNGGVISAGDSLRGTGTVNGDIDNFGTIRNTSIPGLTFKGLLTGVGQGISGDAITFRNGGGFTGTGIVFAPTYGDTAATLTPTGPLQMGRTTTILGFAWDGDVTVGAHTLTLLDADVATLGGLATIAGGTIKATGIIPLTQDSVSGRMVPCRSSVIPKCFRPGALQDYPSRSLLAAP